MSTNTTRETYTIVAGEGESAGHKRVVTTTLRGLKNIVTRESCGGDRWVRAYHGQADNVFGLQPVSL